MKYFNALLFTLFCLFGTQLSAQPLFPCTPGATPGILGNNGTFEILVGDSTPAPFFTTPASGYPDFEFVISANDGAGNPGDYKFRGVDQDGIFDPADFNIQVGEQFSVSPVGYHLPQLKYVVDSILSGTFANLSCCTWIAGFTGVAICDSASLYGISSGNDVTSFQDLITVLSPLIGNLVGGGSLDFTLAEINGLIDDANNLNAPSICGLEALPLCFELNEAGTVTYSYCTQNPNAGTGGNFNVCRNVNTFDLTSTLGPNYDAVGEFQDPTGAAINSELNTLQASSGLYRYISPTPGGNCSVYDTAEITITFVSSTDAVIDYAKSYWCAASETAPSFASVPNPGGFITATAGLGIDTSTGGLDFAASTKNTDHYVYYTIDDPQCPDIDSFLIVVEESDPNALPNDTSVVICRDNGVVDMFSIWNFNIDLTGLWFDQNGRIGQYFNPQFQDEGTYGYSTNLFQVCPEDTLLLTIAIDTNNVNCISDINGPSPSQWEVLAWPNPTDGQLNLLLNIAQENDVEYHIYNLMGSEVSAGVIEKGRQNATIDLQGRSAGIYLLQLSDGVEFRMQRIQLR